VSLIQFLSFSG